MNNQYEQPVQQNHVSSYSFEYLRSYSVCARCIHCGKEDATAIKPSLNCGSYVLFCCVGLAWTIIQKMGRKDYNCHDAEHSCRHCGKFVGKYEAC